MNPVVALPNNFSYMAETRERTVDLNHTPMNFDKKGNLIDEHGFIIIASRKNSIMKDIGQMASFMAFIPAFVVVISTCVVAIAGAIFVNISLRIGIFSIEQSVSVFNSTVSFFRDRNISDRGNINVKVPPPPVFFNG